MTPNNASTVRLSSIFSKAPLQTAPRNYVRSRNNQNSRRATLGALALAGMLAGGQVWAAPFLPAHRYSFTNAAGAAASGAAVLDSVGTAHGTVQGSGATFTGTRVTLSGGSSATAPYVDLPNNLLSNNSTNRGGPGAITLEGWVKVTGGRTWSRIFDFGSSGPCCAPGAEIIGPGGSGEGIDYIMLSAQVGDDTGSRRFEFLNRDQADHGNTTVDHGTTFNADSHFVVTWDEATGQMRVYENGVQRIATSTVAAMSELNDVNVWLGRSNWTGDQNMQGEFDEFRIYNQVMSPEQVLNSFRVGPNAFATGAVQIISQSQSITVLEENNATFSVAAVGELPMAIQWHRGNALIPNATNEIFALTPAHIGDNNAQFFAIISNNVSGTAYFATSSVVTLTVLGDTNAPTVLQVRVNLPTQLEVVFSESIRAQDATNAANFTLTGPGAPSITAASVGTDASRVFLTLSSPLVGCEFYNLAVSGIHDSSVSGNLLAPVNVNFWNYGLPGLTHRYNFNSAPVTNANGATAVDSVGTAHGTIRSGGGATRLTGSRVTLSGGSSATGSYVDLPNGLLSGNSTNNGGSGKVTFEGWVKITGNNSWSRIFDFGSSGPCCAPGGELPGPGGGGEGIDYMFYAAQVGGNTGRRRIDLTNRDQADHGTVGQEFNVLNFNQDMHFVVTWDEATGLINTYEDGFQVATMTTAAAMSEINDVNVWLGRSNWTADGDMAGEFDEFRVYNTVITPADIQRDRVAGPDNNFGGLLGFQLTLATNSMVTNTVAPVRALARFSNLSTQDVTSAGCVVYSSTDSNVVYISADGVIHAGNTGMGTVFASFGGFTNSEIITVTADATPPTILFARGNSSRQIEIAFSEPVEIGTAEESGNYIVSGPSGPIDVNSAVRSLDPSRVLLTLASPMSCEYITVLVSAVADQSPLFNQIAENSPAGFMNYVPMGLQHRYTFNGAMPAPTGTVVPNGAGSADAFILGAGATLLGDVVALPGGSSGSAAYVDLPNGVLSTNGVANGGSGHITIEGWVKVTGNRQWSRIFDFGSSGACCNPGTEITGPGSGGEGIDYLMLSAQVDVNVNSRRLEIQNRDEAGLGNLTMDHPAVFNRRDHFVVTWDERSHLIRAYENGLLVTSATSVAPFSSINDVNVWLGRSTWTGDQNLQGEFDEFRIYNRILSTNEMAFNEAIGPDNNLGKPLAFRFVGTNHMQIGRRVPIAAVVDFSMRSNVDFTMSGCVTLESSNPLVVTNDDAGLHSIGLGTTTLTGRFSGMSTSIVVTVGYPMQFKGLTSGSLYQIQISSQLTGPWNIIGGGTAAADGTITFEDTTPRGPQTFYKAVLGAPPP